MFQKAFLFRMISSCRDFAAGLCSIEVSIFPSLLPITNLFLRREVPVLLQEQHCKSGNIFNLVMLISIMVVFSCCSKSLDGTQYI